MSAETMDLLAWRPAPHNGTATSRAAAAEIEPCMDTLRGRVLTCLRNHPGGLTDEEMQELLGMEGSTQRPRRQELERLGKVVKTLAVRRTRSGRSAAIWQAV